MLGGGEEVGVAVELGVGGGLDLAVAETGAGELLGTDAGVE